MLSIEYSGQFKRDLKRLKKRDKDMGKIKIPMNLLIQEKTLPKVYLDHPLTGNWKGSRDLHIEPDWLLIYTINIVSIRFERTGSHSDLF
ncbi:MAG: type II toxin-antitoxin system YafQ family toxin [Methyloprofundus sp.]